MSICPPNTHALDEIISRPCEEVVNTVQAVQGDVAVLGAGGKMGFHLCLTLQRAMEQATTRGKVIAVSRFGNSQVRQRFVDAGIKTICADLSNADAVSGLPDFENVFFLAGVKFGTDSNADLLDRMNVSMPRLIASRFRRAAIVALSSGCVYSFTTPESGGSDEKSETAPPGEYAQSCLGRESAFSDASDAFGLHSCLIRLNYSIDLRYGVLLDIAQKVRDRQPLDLTTGYVNIIWQGDAISHIIQALAHCTSPPAVFNITGPATLRVRDLAQMFASHWGLEPVFESTESETAWLSNAARSHQLFGAPKISVNQMIQWTAEWLDAGGEVLNRPTKFQVRDGRY